MAKTLLLFLVALVFNTGCTEVDMAYYDNEDYDGGLDYHAEQWGQRRIVRAVDLQEGQPQVVVQNDGDPGSAPKVRTIILDCKPNGVPGNGNNIIRWQITIGVGGAATVFYLDAVGVQQVSVPSSKVTVALVAQTAIVGDTEAVSPFSQPDVDYTVMAGVAIGNTSTNPSTYTISFGISDGGSQIVDVPAGATGFRWTGDSGANTFDAAVVISAVVSASIGSNWTGDLLKSTAYTSEFIPIPGGTKSIAIDNASGADTTGTLQFCLDL